MEKQGKKKAHLLLSLFERVGQKTRPWLKPTAWALGTALQWHIVRLAQSHHASIHPNWMSYHFLSYTYVYVFLNLLCIQIISHIHIYIYIGICPFLSSLTSSWNKPGLLIICLMLSPPKMRKIVSFRPHAPFKRQRRNALRKNRVAPGSPCRASETSASWIHLHLVHNYHIILIFVFFMTINNMFVRYIFKICPNSFK